MAEQLARQDAPQELTWNLADLFADTAAFDAALQTLAADTTALAAAEATFTQDAGQVLAVIQRFYASQTVLEQVYAYASLSTAQDQTDSAAQQLLAKAQAAATAFSAATAWLEPALIALSADQLTAFEVAEPELAAYHYQLTVIRQRRGHVLDTAQEELLATLGQTLDAPGTIQETLDDADLTFGDIDWHGAQALTKGLWGQLATQAPRPVREQAARQMATSYVAHQYTFAQTLNAHVHTQNALAQLRHYDSARQMDLSENQLPESVYDTLLHRTHAHLNLLHRYYALIKRAQGLETLYPYDTHMPLGGTEPPLKPTYEDAKTTALAALAPLGEDYLAHLQDEFDHRWVDVLETRGKTSGGFQLGVYGAHPYILLNWADTYSDMSTLVHESGHALHSVYAFAAQPSWDASYPIFTAEIASTTNESLLNAYLLDQSKGDRATTIYLLTQSVDDFVGTLYRQAQFAEFEQFMYETEAAGTPLTPDTLTPKWQAIAEAYSGPALSQVPWATAGWAQIPHFFYNYYMYQYATSKVIAVSFAHRILTEGAPAVAEYKAFLQAGGSADPVTVLKRAGIDVTQPTYLDEAFAEFEAQLNELEALLK
ncbi:oligoendopeptidase F [Lacticaseibacillus daqingensis]|uniref:oligoendopeptidase F n=1 Tax=Lacticaseibacillus daqingensis TaxID=2486014 RepID=UPI000F7ACCFB|nr:oligoendopeptidase F [Lacticaseibacillus daqingensis]